MVERDTLCTRGDWGKFFTLPRAVAGDAAVPSTLSFLCGENTAVSTEVVFLREAVSSWPTLLMAVPTLTFGRLASRPPVWSAGRCCVTSVQISNFGDNPIHASGLRCSGAGILSELFPDPILPVSWHPTKTIRQQSRFKSPDCRTHTPKRRVSAAELTPRVPELRPDASRKTMTHVAHPRELCTGS